MSKIMLKSGLDFKYGFYFENVCEALVWHAVTQNINMTHLQINCQPLQDHLWKQHRNPIGCIYHRVHDWFWEP